MNIGDAVLANLELLNHVEDPLEVDHGHGHAALAARTGEREGHERCRLKGCRFRRTSSHGCALADDSPDQ